MVTRQRQASFVLYPYITVYLAKVVGTNIQHTYTRTFIHTIFSATFCKMQNFLNLASYVVWYGEGK